MKSGLFFGSLAARLSMILTLGVVGASAASLLVAEDARVRDYQRARLQRVVDSTADVLNRLERDSAGTAALLRDGRIFGAHEAPKVWKDAREQPELDAMLTARLGPQAKPRSVVAPRGDCFPNLDFANRTAGMPEEALPGCSYVRFTDHHGRHWALAVDVAPSTLPPSSILDPRYLLLMLLAGSGFSILAARLVTAPLRRLTDAARAFSVTIDPEPIQERGPQEIRIALETFNIMQQRVREGFRERTQILASITHDLQTPLTRMRLHLEKVADETVRERLIADLAAMSQLVRDGLELARSSESREPWVFTDIDSVLSSIAEDAMEMGQPVRFVGGCNAQIWIKPAAFVRCLSNIADNAVKYGGDAELAAHWDDDDLVVSVRDHGPGLDDIAIGQALQPFTRLAVASGTSIPGTGLGLSIALAQARTFDATVLLSRHVQGGLIVCIRLTNAKRGAVKLMWQAGQGRVAGGDEPQI